MKVRWPWNTMVYHGSPWSYNHGQPWLTMVDHVDHGLINTMANHVRPWSKTMVDHGQRPWLTMVKDHGLTTNKSKIQFKMQIAFLS